MKQMISKETWSAELDEERKFWWHWLTTDKPEIRRQREFRLEPDRQLPADIQRYLPPDGESSKVLDVGAGPITSLGTLFGERPVELIAIDALAREYDVMLAEFGIVPPVRTIFGEGENLVEQFGRGGRSLDRTRRWAHPPTSGKDSAGEIAAVPLSYTGPMISKEIRAAELDRESGTPRVRRTSSRRWCRWPGSGNCAITAAPPQLTWPKGAPRVT